MNWKEWAQDEQGAYVSAGMRVRSVGGKHLVTGHNTSGLTTTYYPDVYEVGFSDGEGYNGISTATSEDEVNEALASAVLDVAHQYENRSLYLQRLAYRVSPNAAPAAPSAKGGDA